MAVVSCAQTQLAPTCVIATLATDLLQMDILVMVFTLRLLI